MDLISLNLNRCLNSHGVYSDTTCPGMVVSQMTLTIMPSFLWHVILPIIFLVSYMCFCFLITVLGLSDLNIILINLSYNSYYLSMISLDSCFYHSFYNFWSSEWSRSIGMYIYVQTHMQSYTYICIHPHTHTLWT